MDARGEYGNDQPNYNVGAPPPAYYPPPQAPRQRRGGGPRTVLVGVGCLIVGLVVGYSAGHGSTATPAASSPIITSAATTPATAASGSKEPAAASSAPTQKASSAPVSAKIGATIALSGQSEGEKLNVTLVKVTDPAKGADQFTQAAAGKHFVGVQLRITNSGTAAYSDSPTNGARLVDGDGQQYDSTYSETTAGKDFGGHVALAPGATALGVINFEVADGAKPTTFQFTLDSGFAEQTGQWQLR